MAILDLYSKRGQSLPDVFVYDNLPTKLRNQIYWIWQKTLLHLVKTDMMGQPYNEAMIRIHESVCAEHGLLYLMNSKYQYGKDLVDALLLHQDVQLVLDIIECSFRYLVTNDPHQMEMSARAAALDLTHRFRENGVGYEFDLSAKKLVRIDHTFTHQNAVRPAFDLLADQAFHAANKEFHEACEDFAEGDFPDCLTKCCAAVESVIKVICDREGWAYQQNDTVSPLIKLHIANTGLPTFLEQPLTLIGTIRNRLSSSHGAGTIQKNAPEYIARYALNATASAILLLVESAN